MRRRKLAIGIRMTPMIDVIFLLLTFFVLTAKFKEPEQRLPILLGPADARAEQTPRVPLTVTLRPTDDGCAVTLAGTAPITLAAGRPQPGLLEVTRRVRAMADAQNRPVELDCDDAVPWDLVVKVYDVLYALGAQDITFRIRDESPSQPGQSP